MRWVNPLRGFQDFLTISGHGPSVKVDALSERRLAVVISQSGSDSLAADVLSPVRREKPRGEPLLRGLRLGPFRVGRVTGRPDFAAAAVQAVDRNHPTRPPAQCHDCPGHAGRHRCLPGVEAQRRQRERRRFVHESDGSELRKGEANDRCPGGTDVATEPTRHRHVRWSPRLHHRGMALQSAANLPPTDPLQSCRGSRLRPSRRLDQGRRLGSGGAQRKPSPGCCPSSACGRRKRQRRPGNRNRRPDALRKFRRRFGGVD